MPVDVQTRLDRIKEARSLGVTQVTENGRAMTFRTLSEMDRVIADLEAEIAGQSRRSVMRQAVPRTNRGL